MASPRPPSRIRALAAVVGLGAIAFAVLRGGGDAGPSGTTLATEASAATAATAAPGTCDHKATVQRGAATSAANGTTTVTIDAVDPARSFLLFSSRGDGNRPVDSIVAARLSGPTTIEVLRRTDVREASPIIVSWSVVSYACGVSVQRGESTPAGTVTDVALARPVAPERAFVTVSKTPNPDAVNFSANDATVADLVAPGTLRFRVDKADPTHRIQWQVVELDADVGKVQRGTAGLAVGQASVTGTITAVDPTKAFVLTTMRTDPATTDLRGVLVRARLTAPTTVTVDRVTANERITEVAWQVVSLDDGSVVQLGDAAFGPGDLVKLAPLAPARAATATAFASVQLGPGLSTGRTGYGNDDVVGEAAATLILTATDQLTLTRESADGWCDISWFVVSWGRA